MAYDAGLAHRLGDIYANIGGVAEKKMFGGLAFMVNGHMSCGIVNETLMVRVGPGLYADALSRPNARPMDFTGKAMKGFIYVAPEGFESDKDLISWVELSLGFVMTLRPK
jgi:TfoX/Sxy family transcriptional regulator of competence genes